MSATEAGMPDAASSVAPALTGTSRKTLLLVFRGAVGAAVVSYLVNLVLLPLVIGRLGAPVYGAWVSVSSFLVLGVLADVGIRAEIIRRVAAAHGADDNEGLTRAVHEGVTLLAGLGAFFLVMGFFCAPLIRGVVFPAGVPGYGPSEVEWFIRATFFVLMISLITNGYLGVLKGVQRGDVEMAAQMVAVPVGGAVTVLGVTLGWGIWALLLGTAGQLFLSSAWQFRRLRKVVPVLRPRLARMTARATRAYLALSGLVLVSQLSDVVDSQWDKLVLSHFVGSAAVTSFQVGTNLVVQGKALVAVPLLPLLAAISEFRGRDEARMEKFFDVLSRTGMVLAAVILGGIFLFAPSFVRLWLGPEVVSAGTAARLFVVAAGCSLYVTPLAYRALAEGWHRLLAVSALVNILVNGILSFWLTVVIGFNGPLYGSIAGNLAGGLMFLILMHRRLGSRWRLPPLRALGIGVTVGAFVLALGLDRVESWQALVLATAAWAVVVGGVAAMAERLPLSSFLPRRAAA